jgi:hypothetical protein
MITYRLARASRPSIADGQRTILVNYCLSFDTPRTLEEIVREAERRHYLMATAKTETDTKASVRYHLRALIKDGVVVTEPAGGPR